MSVSFKLAWYDLWIGAFIDKRHNPLITKVYICPLPCCLITIEIRKHPHPETKGSKEKE